MSLNLQKGNMYPFVTHTWNPIKGKCSHDCTYCYMKSLPGKQKPIHLDGKELRTNLGEGNYIFVGSGTDMFARDVPQEWIGRVLEVCRKYPENTYLFQTKDPAQLWIAAYMPSIVFGTTIETNRAFMDPLSTAPTAGRRAAAIGDFSRVGFRTMVTIEPVVDFDVEQMTELLVLANPEWVNIGADSKKHGLPEPSPEKLQELIHILRQFTDVKLKDNLRRLLPEGMDAG